MKYGFIREHREQFPVARLCRQLAVSRSGFHAWLRRPASVHRLRDEKLLVDIGVCTWSIDRPTAG